MDQQVYVQPAGLVYGPDAAAAIGQGDAGRLGGATIGFTQAWVRSRQRTGATGRARSYGDLRAAGERAIEQALEAIERPREAVPGLPRRGAAIMGVVNVTPDSFSDGGLFADTDHAIAHGRSLRQAGADILDIGGESTRPGSDPMPDAEELARVIPVIEALAGDGVPVSIDTRKSAVMRAAVEAGACLVNDISALQHDPDALATVRDLAVPVVLMHSRGDPKTMQEKPEYDDVVLDVYDALAKRIEACKACGIEPRRIIVDPGIGFGKTFSHNHALLRGLTVFHGLEATLMLGVSRKAFIGALSGETVAGKRVAGSVAAALIGLTQGVRILRVHDVAETVQAVRTWRGVWAHHADDGD